MSKCVSWTGKEGIKKLVDACDTIQTVLTNSWTAANTDSVTPVFAKIVEKLDLDLNNSDYVLLYEVDENTLPFGIGASSWAEQAVVSVDLRTTYKLVAIGSVRPHLIKMKDEVNRIIRASTAAPDANFNILMPLRRRDLSDKTIGIGRMVIDCVLRRWNA